MFYSKYVTISFELQPQNNFVYLKIQNFKDFKLFNTVKPVKMKLV